MEEINTSESESLLVADSLRRLGQRVEKCPERNRRSVIAAIMNRALISLDKKEPDNEEWVDDDTDENTIEIHPLITEESLRERKQKDNEFKFDTPISPIHDTETLIPDMEHVYGKRISAIANSLIYDLKQIKGLTPSEIQNMILDQATKGLIPLL